MTAATKNSNHTNAKPYVVTGDHTRMVYSRHSTYAAACRACAALARKWGWSHPGSEPLVEAAN